jgi:hypothetical protein
MPKMAVFGCFWPVRKCPVRDPVHGRPKWVYLTPDLGPFWGVFGVILAVFGCF